MTGYWCVHCEQASDAKSIAHDDDGDMECPHCQAGEWDLWRIAGDFANGQHIPTGSEELAALLVQDDSAFA